MVGTQFTDSIECIQFCQSDSSARAQKSWFLSFRSQLQATSPRRLPVFTIFVPAGLLRSRLCLSKVSPLPGKLTTDGNLCRNLYYNSLGQSLPANRTPCKHLIYRSLAQNVPQLKFYSSFVVHPFYIIISQILWIFSINFPSQRISTKAQRSTDLGSVTNHTWS